MPLRRDEVTKDLPFSNEELLYRRVGNNGVNSAGELLPSELNTLSFDREIDGAPSVLRGAYASPKDVLERECAEDKDVSSWLVYEIAVGSLPSPIVSDDGKSFDFFPVHRPLELCGAHSVIASCRSGDEHKAYLLPPRSVRNSLRAKMATLLRPVQATASPVGR